MEERTLVSFDYAVKYLLRDKADFVILSGFLTELMGRKVEVQEILESESNKDDAEGKTNRVDMKAKIDNGELAVFEFQFHEAVDFFGRVLYGVSQAIIGQTKRGRDYGIKKVYSINVAYYDVGAKQEYLFYGKFGGFKGLHFEETVPFGNPETPENDIHPEYYLILPKMFDEKLRGRFDEWIYILKNSAVPEGYTAKGISEASVKLDLLRMTPEDREAYYRYLDNHSSVESAIQTALKNGRKEGLAEGEAKGKAEGRIEEKIEIAKNLKNLGIPDSQITTATGLTSNEISRL